MVDLRSHRGSKSHPLIMNSQIRPKMISLCTLWRKSKSRRGYTKQSKRWSLQHSASLLRKMSYNSCWLQRARIVYRQRLSQRRSTRLITRLENLRPNWIIVTRRQHSYKRKEMDSNQSGDMQASKILLLNYLGI